MVPHSLLRKQYPFRYDPTTNQLLHRSNLGYSIHTIMTANYDNIPSGYTESPRGFPVAVKDPPDTWQILQPYFPLLPPPAPPPMPTSISQHLQSLPQWELQLLQHTELLVPEATIKRTLETTTCFMASDGSAPTGKGSFAWVLSNTQGTRLAQGQGPVFGRKISSYRAEAYGILAGLRFLRRVQQIHTSSIHNLHWVCDNKGLISKLKKLRKYTTHYPNSTMDADWDALHEITLNCPTNLHLRHIKGHQDQTCEYDELPLQAQLNCDADALATQYLNNYPDQDHTRVPILPSNGAQLELPDGTAT